jgi:hypothetical protein
MMATHGCGMGVAARELFSVMSIRAHLASRAGLLLTAALHAAALVRIWQTEYGLFAQSLAVLAWIVLNCVWLLIQRRPAVAAALSFAMIEILIRVSLFKFKITWMTATFLDVMVIDPDSFSFLLSVMPGLRLKVAGLCLGGAALLALLWKIDAVRVPRRVTTAAGGVALVLLVVLSNAVPEKPHEPFQGVNHVSGFTRSTVVSLSELSKGGWLDVDRAVASRLPAAPADAACTPAGRRPHIIMVLDESSFDIRRAPGVVVPENYGDHFRSVDGKTRRLITEGAGGPTWYTEYNVLTGLSAQSFGRMMFHVTRLAAGRVERGLPQALVRCGYKTVTLYPAYGAFLSARRFQKTAGVQRLIDSHEMGAGDVEPDSFYYAKASKLIAAEHKKAPLFVFVYTVANHFPWNTTFRPDLTPQWKSLNANAEADEYIRRQSMSAADYKEFVAGLRRDFPDDAFLIVRFGDHPPAIAPRLIAPSLSDDEIGKHLMERDPAFYTAYYVIDAINFTPADLSSARDALDAPYLPLVVQEAAGLPLDSTFVEQKKILARCEGVFHGCKDGAEARRFNRLLMDAGLIKGF